MQNDILRTLALLEIHDVACGKIRVGGSGDGGYVMANDFSGNPIAYSIGVGPQVQWDEEMAAKGFHIWQYDHTVPGLPSQHPNFHYQKLGIGAYLGDPELITLAEMLQRNGHANETGMILKIDVEGAEWHCFESMDDEILGRFDQIVVEYHGLEYLADARWCERAERVFARINRHHAAIHVHGNNYGEIRIVEGIPVPGVIEISYANRAKFALTPSNALFPSELDTPCDPARPDLILGSFRFS